MRNPLPALLAVAIAALALTLWWFADSSLPDPDPEPARPKSPPGRSAEGHMTGDGAAREAKAPKPATAPEDDRQTVEPDPEWDPDAKEWLVFLVLDEINRPVVGAKIEPYAMRSKQSPGTHFFWRQEEQPLGTSDGQGRVRVWYPVWTARRKQTSSITFRVKHTHFPTQREELEVGPGDKVVVLRRGSFVTVSGWIDGPDDLITDVKPKVSYYSGVKPEDWIYQAGRKPSTHKMPAGKHSLFLHHVRDGRDYFSKVVIFEIQKRDVKDLHLKMVPARKLTGRLDERVPRPVQNGAVSLNLGIRGGNAWMSREHMAKVAANGTFEFPSLPPGKGEIIGICDGWVSAEEDFSINPELRPDEMPNPEYLQKIDLTAAPKPYVLKMQKAATLVATILDDTGKPLAGATIILGPNVHWASGSSNYFMRREHKAVSDAKGRAVVRDLPPGPPGNREGYRVTHEHFWMPLRRQEHGSPERVGTIELKSGITKEITVRLERRPVEQKGKK